MIFLIILKKIIVRYKKTGNIIDSLLGCLSNQGNSFAYLINCMTDGQASD